jgi:hypothetical protein
MIGKSVEEVKAMGKFNRPKFFALFRIDWSKSAARTKRRGERGSPCLTPLLQWIVLSGTPLSMTFEVPE